jgi:hypothetical protein
VEIYQMKVSDEAFGLLSTDWSGEPVTFHEKEKSGGDTGNDSFPSALYGKGYLRIRSGNLYVRILAVRDTPAARETIMTFGRIITGGVRESPPPQMARSLPKTIRGGWHPNYRKLTYFRSHLVLNAVYYLSHENILNLGPGTAGVYCRYEKDGEKTASDRMVLLNICYPGEPKAGLALNRFVSSYLEDLPGEKEISGSVKAMNFFKIEDGWMGYRKEDNRLALVFQCPDRLSAGVVLKALW